MLHKGKALKIMHDKPAKDAEKEAKKQTYAYDAGLPVPKVHRAYGAEGNAYVLMDYIKGCNFVEACPEDPVQIKEYMQTLVGLQIQMHQLDGGDLIDMKQHFREKIKKVKISRRIKRKYIKELKHLEYNTCLCHMDYHPMNLLLSEEGKPYIIDWSNACAGSREADVCNSYLILTIIGQKELAELYLTLYCAMSNMQKADIWNCMGLVACMKLSEKRSDEEKANLLEIVMQDYKSKSIFRFLRKK